MLTSQHTAVKKSGEDNIIFLMFFRVSRCSIESMVDITSLDTSIDQPSRY